MARAAQWAVALGLLAAGSVAAAPPEGLYKGDRLGFEFQRTISRLTEMQSEEYLASEHRP